MREPPVKRMLRVEFRVMAEDFVAARRWRMISPECMNRSGKRATAV